VPFALECCDGTARREQGEMTASGGAPPDDRDRRARAEAALHSGDPSYRLIVDTLPALIATMTPEGEVEHVNRRVYEYFGRTLDELKKWGMVDAVHPDDLPRVIDAWRSAVATGLPYEIEHRMRRADGVYRWFQVRGVPLRDDAERIVRWHVLMTDIDERKDSETRVQSSLKEIERLKDENELRARHLRLLTETTPHMLWSATPNGLVDYVNQRMLDYAQLTHKEFLGVGWGRAIHPDHVRRMSEAWAASVASGELFEFEFLGRHAPSSSWRWCVSSALPARDADGRIIKWYGSVVDLHDRKQAEDTRLQAERQYRTVVETATDAVITIDATSVIQLVNPAVTKIFGYEPSELIGQPLTVLMPERLANHHLTGVQQYVETGHRRRNWSAIELIGLRKNGEEFPVEVSFAEVINDGQRTFTGFIRDVTERKQAEELRAARSRQVAVRADVSSALETDNTLRGTLQSCAEAVVKHLGAAFARIWIVTKDGRFLELQASAGMYTHLDGAHRLVPVGQLKIGLIALERTPHVTNDVINDPRLSNPDWARVEGMVAFAGFPLVAGGQVVGVLAMFSREPISQGVMETLATISDTIAQSIQRKQAEEDVRRSETFLAEAQALSQTGSWGWNTATGDLFWSRETYRLLGFEPDVIPTLPMVAEAIHPDDRARFEHDAQKLARDHTDLEGEYRLKLRDGSIKHVYFVGRFAARVFPDLDFIGSIMDVTERKQAADALLKAQLELSEVTRLTTMGELAASIAHEINQPLATVVTNAQACARLLHAQPPPWDDVVSAVLDIAEAGKRASDVIDRIRLLLRKGVSEPVALSVNDVIRDVIALTRDTTQTKRVMLDTRLTHDVPQVLADRVQLQQVLINLITNAADAMSDVTDRPRRLTISSSCNDELQVEVAVVDAGVGIDPKCRDRIFDPFFTTKADGMGMGLAICRGIVDAHGGRLWAAPNPEFGTTVRLALPAVATEEA
jgi:PAS domain S-box-containing protein